ncbi:MAG: hypothetical protein HY821_13800, partial [Acidobacteria bacterium]|nr:hypothetical protein [Acidobacteriota bacterium]
MLALITFTILGVILVPAELQKGVAAAKQEEGRAGRAERREQSRAVGGQEYGRSRGGSRMAVAQLGGYLGGSAGDAVTSMA